MDKGKKNTAIPSWAKTIIESTVNDRIPIKKDITRGASKSKVSFYIDNVTKAIIEKIIFHKNNKKFERMSEVNRAAFHIGIIIIFALIADDADHDDNIGGERQIMILNSMFKRLEQLTLIDNCTKAMKCEYDAFKFGCGLVGEDEMNNNIEDLINTLPSDKIKDAVREKFKKLQSGERLSNLLELEPSRGDKVRKIKG